MIIYCQRKLNKNTVENKNKMHIKRVSARDDDKPGLAGGNGEKQGN